ncbi:MAG: phosphoribosylformylglycinamidine synthase subunit PurL [bacterium]
MSFYGNCLPAEEKVVLKLKGNMECISLEELADRFIPQKEEFPQAAEMEDVQILSYDPKSLSVCWKKALKVFRRKAPSFVEVITASGRRVLATHDHPLLTFRGGVRFINAGELEKGDTLLLFQDLSYPRPTRVVDVRDIKEERWVFDVEVEDTHIFLTQGGFAVHNCIGVPTVGGEIYFEDAYEDNPLVNVMCVGLGKIEELQRGRAEGVGNLAVLIGSSTGRDGIAGAAFASVELGPESESKRPQVQIGDPFSEKLLIEAVLEAIKTGAVVGVQDMGAAGITSSTSETAARAGTGMELDLDKVPLREAGMTPFEIMLSESQERMLLIVKRGEEEKVKKVMEKWGLNYAPIGVVTDDGILRVKHKGEIVAEVPAKLLAEAPRYRRKLVKPSYIDELSSFNTLELPEPKDYNEVLLRLLASPNIASKEWVYEQYDHMVLTNTVIYPGGDSALLRIKGTSKGIAIKTDGNGRYVYLNPYKGAMIAVAEAARNISATGAQPLAITDCLNFGSPEKGEVIWQFSEAIKGMAKAASYLNIPIISGNVSFYNESPNRRVFPTPVVGMLGLIEDIEKRVQAGFRRTGDIIILVGETFPELGGSEYLKEIFGKIAGEPPAVDLEREWRANKLCQEAVGLGLLSSAHDIAEGGLAVALAEACVFGKVGATIRLPATTIPPSYYLFSESQARFLLSLPKENLHRLEGLAEELGVPITVLGEVGGQRLYIEKEDGEELINLSLKDINDLWRNSIPRIMES